MRWSIRDLLQPWPPESGQPHFDAAGRMTHTSGGLVLLRHGDEIDRCIEDQLRTYMMNGTEPEELEREANANNLAFALRFAKTVVDRRAYEGLPTPDDCQYAQLLKSHT